MRLMSQGGERGLHEEEGLENDKESRRGEIGIGNKVSSDARMINC